MLTPPTETTDSSDRNRQSDPSLLVVDDDRIAAAVERSFDGDGADVVVETVATLEDAWNRVDDVDCLVIASAATAEPGADEATRDDAPEIDVAELDDRLEAIGTNAPELPTVVLVPERTAEIARTVRSHDWTAVLEESEISDRFADRVHGLLERGRLAALSRRSLASIEFAGAAIAVVDPSGDVQFASRSFAMQFGDDTDAIAGTPWRELFTDAAVDHLESAAIPMVANGWQWTGTCTGRRRTGETFPVRVRLGSLEDGSLVVVLDGGERRDGLED
ncbi:PAS domain-containing protein [Natrinema salsiterrestre]|uniref:PAS domain-containing protein n=1 Tax=Natrinema salsiterrestre TaxID=2950540 RepID=A0A9Q4L2X9_9EURY|nr:PAS domain-containing protein [Natrinema salsiterrestre]MDF9747261.1 PAS domain-containing protein [Natrinema salsiterrestre]